MFYAKIDRMATRIYKTNYVHTIDGQKIKIIPLKIKYLHGFMENFDLVTNTNNDNEAIDYLVECVRIAMEQYYPELSDSRETVEDNFDLPTIYKILDYAAGIKINQAKEDEEISVKEQAETNKDNQSWSEFDLLKLEQEAFIKVAVWNNIDHLEDSLCLPELISLISSFRELDYKEKKFMAAMQGIDLDKQGGGSERGQKEWEDLKARVFSKGKVTDSNDILALQGPNAEKVGFGIGLGLEYEDERN